MICHIKSCSHSICGVCNNMNDFDCEYKDYRAIGTKEECREAREKQEPKKPDKVNMTTFCGDCYATVKRCYDFCPTCGRAIDWERSNHE